LTIGDNGAPPPLLTSLSFPHPLDFRVTLDDRDERSVPFEPSHFSNKWIHFATLLRRWVFPVFSAVFASWRDAATFFAGNFDKLRPSELRRLTEPVIPQNSLFII